MGSSFLCQERKCLKYNEQKGEKNNKADHSMLPWSCHGADAAGFTELTHRSGLESSYCVWDCDLIIPVTGLVERVLSEGWRIKTHGLGETEEENSKNTVLVFKVSATESSISRVWNKPPHTLPLWNSARLWKIKTQDGIKLQNLKYYFLKSVTSIVTDIIAYNTLFLKYTLV